MAISYKQRNATPAVSSAGFPWCASGTPAENGWFLGVAEEGGAGGGSQGSALVSSNGSWSVGGWIIVPSLITTWDAGTWTVRFNVASANANWTLTAAYICRLDVNGNNLSTIGSLTGQSISCGTTGVKTFSVSGSAVASPNPDDVIAVVIVSTNAGGMSFSQLTVAHDQDIDSPFTSTAVSFRETDTNSTTTNFPWCSPNAAASTPIRKTAVIGGTAGTGTLVPSLASLATSSAISWVLAPDGTIYWNPGAWIIPVDVTVANANFASASLYACRLDAAFAVKETLGSNGSVGNIFTTTGIKNVSCTVSAPIMLVAGDVLAFVIVIVNSAMSVQTVSYKSDQLITGPWATMRNVGGVIATDFPAPTTRMTPYTIHRASNR